MTTNFPDREFQFWQYQVSHGELLIRSPKSRKLAHNIDIMFYGVHYVALPRHLSGVTFEDPSETDLDRVQSLYGPIGPFDKLFVLTSGPNRHLVVAAAMKVMENDLDLFDTPLTCSWSTDGIDLPLRTRMEARMRELNLMSLDAVEWKPHSKHLHMFVVYRVDFDSTGQRSLFTTTKAVLTREEAEAAVERLNKANAAKDCEYEWQVARLVLPGES